MLDFILSKLAVWGLLGVPFYLVARWILRVNSAQLNWVSYLIIIYLVLIVLQGWIEDWDALSAQREVERRDERRSSGEEARRRRRNEPCDEECLAIGERDWQMLKRREDSL
jgi:hypothetical protein